MFSAVVGSSGKVSFLPTGSIQLSGFQKAPGSLFEGINTAITNLPGIRELRLVGDDWIHKELSVDKC